MDHYIARPEVEKKILDAVATSDKLLFLTGPRGSGKTTLLRRLQSVLDGSHRTALIQIEPIAASPEILCERFLKLAAEVLADVPDHAPSFDHLLRSLSRGRSGAMLLLDELTEVRTLSYFPGVEKPLESFLTAITGPRAPKCLATSRFSYWLCANEGKLPGAVSSRIERVHLPPLSPRELEAEGVVYPERWIAATGGLLHHVRALLDRTRGGGGLDQALVAELSPGERIEAECRATLAQLLHRARGYGACKAALTVLAVKDGITLSEIAREMRRTAGSTRDYLRWLEEVDLIESRDKRFSISDPILRLWLRIYGRGAPASESDIREEVDCYLNDVTPEARKSEPLGVEEDKEDELIEID